MGGITFSISLYIMCIYLFSALSRRVGALQIILLLLLCEPSAVTLTLETVTEYFCATLWLMMMHQHTMFGYKRSSGSDEIIDKTQIHKNKGRWIQGFQYRSLLPLPPNDVIRYSSLLPLPPNDVIRYSSLLPLPPNNVVRYSSLLPLPPNDVISWTMCQTLLLLS